LEGEREQGDGGDSDEEGEEVIIHDEARVESTDDNYEADNDHHNLEDNDDNAVVLARNNMHITVYPRMRLSQPPFEWVSPLPKLDKGEPIYSDVSTPGNWQQLHTPPRWEKANKSTIACRPAPSLFHLKTMASTILMADTSITRAGRRINWRDTR
jgi:hypothetical protein